jgi:DNA ligase-1
MADGTRFAVGTGFSDAEREDPPPVGSVITFRYQELSEGGVPRFPSYIGVRHDVKFPEKPAAPKAPAARPTPAAVPSGVRHFECVGNSSSKFWEVSVGGNTVTTRYGRIGSPGQSTTKEYADTTAAQAAAAKLIAEKTGKGYVEK